MSAAEAFAHERAGGGTLLPGATIGIFGGGQLGRMMAMAARGMGYRSLVLDPDPGCPARFVVDGCIEAAWDDSRGAAMLARGCDVVTLEIEQIGEHSMASAATFCPVRPGGALLAIIQTASSRRTGCTSMAFRWASFARSARSRRRARPSRRSAASVFCKSATGGYDGRGQGKVGFAGAPTEAGLPVKPRCVAPGKRWAKGLAWSNGPWSSNARSA